MDTPLARLPLRLLAFGLLAPLLLCLGGCGDDAEPKDSAATEAETSSAPTAAAPAPVSPETIVCTVDGQPIKQGEVDTFLRGMFGIRQELAPDQMNQLRTQYGKSAEGKLIEKQLVAQAVAAANVEVTDAELEARWMEITRALPPGITLDQHLARSGFSRERADEEMRRMIGQDKLIEQRGGGGAPPTDAEIAAFYEENKQRFGKPERVHARHILLKFEPTTTTEQREEMKGKLETLRQELLAEGGATFEEMAASHSGCPSAAQGGDLGWFARGQMVPPFEKTAFELQPGVVSDVVETQFGYHIIRVDEREDPQTQPFEEVKESIRLDLHNRARQQAQREFVDSLRKTAKIEYPGGK